MEVHILVVIGVVHSETLLASIEWIAVNLVIIQIIVVANITVVPPVKGAWNEDEGGLWAGRLKK